MVEESFVVRKKRMTVTNGTDVFTITIRKRSWWFWALAGLSLLSEVVLLQTVWASVNEGEIRAATISGIAVFILAVAGVLLWLRRGRSYKLSEPSKQPTDAFTSVEIQGQN
jgi:hypothetical protein